MAHSPSSSPVYESPGGYLATDCPLCGQEVKAECNGRGWRFTCRGGHSDAEVRERLPEAVTVDLDRRREAKRRETLPEAGQLAAMLGLDKAGLSIKGARIVGRGSAASADLFLSDGTTVKFWSLGDFATPKRLAVEVVSQSGAPCPAMSLPEALKALGLLRRVAAHVEAGDLDEAATDWGLSYLDGANLVTVDMSDGRQRFGAFESLRQDAARARRTVLVDLDGVRYVRTGWFFDHARLCDRGAGSNAQIATRMERVGWSRRGKRGRIKATSLGAELHHSFFEVPGGWESSAGASE